MTNLGVSVGLAALIVQGPHAATAARLATQSDLHSPRETMCLLEGAFPVLAQLGVARQSGRDARVASLKNAFQRAGCSLIETLPTGSWSNQPQQTRPFLGYIVAWCTRRPRVDHPTR